MLPLLFTLKAAQNLHPSKCIQLNATPVNQDQTASSVTVLTEKDFAERNATYVSDVLKTVPGVAMGVSGGRGTLTSLFLRGANSNQAAVIKNRPLFRIPMKYTYCFDHGVWQGAEMIYLQHSKKWENK